MLEEVEALTAVRIAMSLLSRISSLLMELLHLQAQQQTLGVLLAQQVVPAAPSDRSCRLLPRQNPLVQPRKGS